MSYGPSIQDDVKRAREIMKDGVVGKDLYSVIKLLASLADEVERLHVSFPHTGEPPSLRKSLAAELAASPSGAAWQCGARASTDPPQDCNWPLCGCDPGADKVITALQECGWSSTPCPSCAEKDERIEQLQDKAVRLTGELLTAESQCAALREELRIAHENWEKALVQATDAEANAAELLKQVRELEGK